MPFHMLSSAKVLQSVANVEWFISINLKDAYFHVPFIPGHSQSLNFAFQGPGTCPGCSPLVRPFHRVFTR